MRGVMGY